jgi:peptidoglycan/LPS O-acetylase OafA/YrhL
MTFFLSSKNFSNQRICGFDYLRVICAVLVVAIHSFDTNLVLSNFISYFKFPVPIFLMISFFLLFRKVYYGTNKFPFYLKQRCSRLLPCFCVWTIVYLSIRVIANSHLSFSLNAIAGYLFFGSAAVQLYYLPLTIYYCIILLPFIFICKKYNVIYSTLAFGLIIIAIAINNTFTIYDNKDLLDRDLKIFLQYATSYLIYSVMGIYFAFLIICDRANTSQAKYTKFLPLVILTIIAVLRFEDNQTLQNLQIIINLIIFALFYYIPFPYNQAINYLAKISFGIYLSHHLFIEVFQVIEQKAGYSLDNFYLTMINFLLGIGLSIVFSTILYKTKKLQFLVV